MARDWTEKEYDDAETVDVSGIMAVYEKFRNDCFRLSEENIKLKSRIADLEVALENIVWLCDSSPSTDSIKENALSALKGGKND